MRILCTGGCGFIGSHIVDALIERGHDVSVLDCLVKQVHPTTRPPSYLNPKADYIYGKIGDRELIQRILTGVDVVFHEAALVGVGQSMGQISRYMNDNTLETAKFLEAMVTEAMVIRHDRKPFKKLIVASSMSVYGEGTYTTTWDSPDPMSGRTLESKPLQPASPYAISKRDQEELCLLVGKTYGIPTVALRYFNVYGDRQALTNPYTGIAVIFANKLLKGEAPLIYEDGLQTRDFVHVSDIVQANLLAMDTPDMNNGVYNVGTGRALTVLAMAKALSQEITGGKIEPIITNKYRPGDVRHCYADISRIKHYGYEPKVKFEDGIPALVKWCRSQMNG